MTEPGISILLVDDDEDDYFITKDLLSDIESSNLKLDWARDYDSALAALSRESHDVYLLDYRLGARDGLALMKEVLSHGRRPPVILLTGQDDPEIDIQAMKGGAADFLIKGQITSSSLERSIRYAVERSRVEAQLSQREEELRLTLVNAPLGIFTCDLDLRILSVNLAFESIVGSSADRLRGTLVSELMSPGCRGESERLLRDLISGKTEIGRMDRAFLGSEGRQIEAVVTVRLMCDPGGRPQQLVGHLEDVTERRELERQLAQAEKLKSIGQLAAGVAHEINTPTQFVAHNLEFLAAAFVDLIKAFLADRGADRALPEGLRSGPNGEDGGLAEELDLDYLLAEIPKTLEQSLHGIEQVSTIVRSVSELAQPSSGTRELVNLNRAVEASVLLTSNQWKRCAEVSTDLDPHLPRVECLPGAINQVLLNLLANAAEAIADHRGDHIDAGGQIRISTSATNGWVEIEIEDNGGGIPEHLRARVFDPFFTSKLGRQSTGQGLAIAHSIVVGQHKGRILVDSEEGRGATFTVQLPVAVGTRLGRRDGDPRDSDRADR